MIFNYVNVEDKTYNVDGQVRVSDDAQFNVSFNDLTLGNDLKRTYDNRSPIDSIVFKLDDHVKHGAKAVRIENLTIDNNGYRVTFKEK